ncbi:MAG: hypothetical protein ACODAD_08165 [Planctomycetota bacterium]
MQWEKVIGSFLLTLAVITWGAVIPRVSAQQDQPRVQRRRAASIDAALNDPDNKQETALLREGTRLSDEAGTFDMAGNRLSFEIAGRDVSLQVLENLALERIWKTFDNAGGREWSVSGVVTEYRDQNYLLIQRAVLRMRDGSKQAGSR